MILQVAIDQSLFLRIRQIRRQHVIRILIGLEFIALLFTIRINIGLCMGISAIIAP